MCTLSATVGQAGSEAELEATTTLATTGRKKHQQKSRKQWPIFLSSLSFFSPDSSFSLALAHRPQHYSSTVCHPSCCTKMYGSVRQCTTETKENENRADAGSCCTAAAEADDVASALVVIAVVVSAVSR